MHIRDRVKELRRVRAGDLIPHPRNWRTHPKAQADALRGVLAEVGYASALLARETPNGLQLIDGHLRAETTPDMEVPVLVLDVTEAEAEKILLTHDPLAAMAEANEDALAFLLREVRTEDDAVREMLDGMMDSAPEILGAKDEVDRAERAGDTPWARIDGSDTVRCLVGDVEFGISRAAAEVFAAVCRGDEPPRIVARAWMENALLRP